MSPLRCSGGGGGPIRNCDISSGVGGGGAGGGPIRNCDFPSGVGGGGAAGPIRNYDFPITRARQAVDSERDQRYGQQHGADVTRDHLFGLHGGGGF